MINLYVKSFGKMEALPDVGETVWIQDRSISDLLTEKSIIKCTFVDTSEFGEFFDVRCADGAVKKVALSDIYEVDPTDEIVRLIYKWDRHNRGVRLSICCEMKPNGNFVYHLGSWLIGFAFGHSGRAVQGYCLDSIEKLINLGCDSCQPVSRERLVELAAPTLDANPERFEQSA